jgi:hypothetical protein
MIRKYDRFCFTYAALNVSGSFLAVRCKNYSVVPTESNCDGHCRVFLHSPVPER